MQGLTDSANWTPPLDSPPWDGAQRAFPRRESDAVPAVDRVGVKSLTSEYVCWMVKIPPADEHTNAWNR